MCDSKPNKLLQDPLFWLVQILAGVFLLVLYLVGMNLAGLAWIKQHLWLLFQLILVYPVLEEIVFRGLLQERLWASRYGRGLAYGISLPNLITSVIFTTVHFFFHPPLWALAVFIPSLVFGFFRDRYQNLFPAIYLHCLFNAGYFLLYGN